MDSLPTLDTVVLATIDDFIKNGRPNPVDMNQFHLPLVVGSGNGLATGRIIFRNSAALFCSESDVEEKLQAIPSIQEVVVVSASGEKHAPIILEQAKKLGKKTFLISSTEGSSGSKIADTTFIFPKIREPYTYNTSTYFGYIYGLEKEKASLSELKIWLKDIFDPIFSTIDWSKYSSFCLVIPNQFVLLRDMLETKFIELFGRKIARDIFTYEQMKHATTVVQDEGELFLCFDNITGIQYGKNQVNLPIFHESSYAMMMLVGYYLIGNIQKSFSPYFIESIEDYCQRAKEQSGFTIKPWVEV